MKTELVIFDKPNGLDYDVDMSQSTYGKETTASEDEAAAQQLVKEHIAQLENASSEPSQESVANNEQE